MKTHNFEKSGIFVGENTIFQGKVVIEKKVKIWHNCTIGFSEENKPFVFKNVNPNDLDTTFLGQETVVEPYSLISQGSKIGRNVEINEYSRIGYGSQIDDNTKIVYGAKIYDDVIIGSRSIISGFCCNGSKIGNETTMMGHLIHKYPTHAIDIWEEMHPPAPVIEDNVIVGYNAIIIGGITIGKNSYIAAGAIICKDVPPNTKIISSQTYKISKR